MGINIKVFLDEKEDIINEMFYAREDKISVFAKTDEKYIKELEEKKTMFNLALDNIPTYFKNSKRAILDAFVEYTENVNSNNSDINEVYYKSGVVDGIRLILETLKN